MPFVHYDIYTKNWGQVDENHVLGTCHYSFTPTKIRVHETEVYVSVDRAKNYYEYVGESVGDVHVFPVICTGSCYWNALGLCFPLNRRDKVSYL